MGPTTFGTRRLGRLAGGLAFVVLLTGRAVAAEPPAELAAWLGPQAWEKDTSGPIVALGAAGAFDDTHIFAPAVMLEDGRFQMLYSGSSGRPSERVFRLGLATSADGRQFARHSENPVFEFGQEGRSVLTPGPLRASDGAPLREGGRLRLYFTAADLRAGHDGTHTLHETSSEDGIQWAAPSPALLKHAYCPSVLRTEAGYEMWFTDVERRPWIIRHATSADGTTWTVTPEPALQLSQAWEGEVLVYPTVLKAGDAYLMWYGSYDNAIRRETTAIGFAVSRDGRRWFKHPANPVIRPDPERAWESNYVGSGSVVRLPEGGFRYFYASRTAPPFRHLYFAINTARWDGPASR